MKYLQIKSKGEINSSAFTLIGATTKRNDETKIGLYGSGNKYAISALIRNNIDFRVFSGETEIRFSTKDTSFRDQDFSVILVNGKETSLTTNMGGEDWDDPFAPIREIYSNAIDEDEDACLEICTEFLPESGYTKIFIECTEKVMHFYNKKHLYFCKDNPNVIHATDKGSLYPYEEGFRVYRKGILAHHRKDNNALFNYNFERGADINESRVLRDEGDARWYIPMILKSLTDKNLIKNIVTYLAGGNSGLEEHHGYWKTSTTSFSNEWKEVVQSFKFYNIELEMFFEPHETQGRLAMKTSILDAFSQEMEVDILGNSKSGVVYKKANQNEILINKVIDALAKLNSTRYSYRISNPIIEYVCFQEERVLGKAEDGKILLSEKLDTYSVDEIAKIIIEENEHNKTGYSDNTRNFQNHLFNLYYDELLTTQK